jgi:hypothetical protein
MKRAVSAALKSVVAFGAVLFAGSLAQADTLHAFCVLPATCSDNGTVTPTTSNPLTFGFTSSGHNQGGSFLLFELVPDNELATLTIDGTNTTDATATGNLFSATEILSSDKLATFLCGGCFVPPSPISNYLPSTQAVDPAAGGYFVYEFNFGALTADPKTNGPTFKADGSGGLPLGSIFVALLTSNNNSSTVSNVIGATPQSAALLEQSGPPTAVVPEPTAIVLLGSGLLITCVKLRRKLTWS